MTASKHHLKSLLTETEYYAETFAVFSKYSATNQVITKWVDTMFRQKVVEKLSICEKDEQEDKLRIMGVGSGSGEMDCEMITHLLKKFPSISNTVIEPALSHIEDYKKLVDGKGFDNVEFDWVPQTWDEFFNEYKQKARATKFHFISAIHSLYYVADLEASLLNLMNCLEEGGILVIILLSDTSGFWRLWNRFPMLKDEIQHQINSGYVRRIFDKNNITYEAISQESRVDITSCYEDGNKDGSLLTDFVTHVVNFRETASKSFVEEVLAYMRGADCSIQERDEIFLNNDWQAIIVSK